MIKTYLYFILASLLILSCKSENKDKPSIASSHNVAETEMTNNVIKGAGYEIPSYNFDSFEGQLYKDDEKIHVINFWATWCKPCIAELPLFEEVTRTYGEAVEVTLVSLDFPDQIESRLIPFLDKNNIESNVVFLDDPKTNTWIPKVNKEWSGAIPATLIYTSDSREFYEKSFKEGELEREILKLKEL